MFEFIKNLFHREQTSKQEKIISGILAFVYIFVMGMLGKAEPGEWYANLIRPEITPPSQVFGIAWTILFVLLAASMYHMWNYYKNSAGRKWFTAFYVISGFLIYAWSDTFFMMHDMVTALFMILVMIILAEVMILIAFQNNKKSGYLLLPYLAWLLFALYLNTNLIILNA